MATVTHTHTSVHCVAFQSTTAVLLSEEGNGALGYICWSEDFEYDHDAYYQAHFAVLDGAFQLIGLMTKTVEDASCMGVSWDIP